MQDELGEQCRREVIELHAFFQGWLGGVLPEDEETFARFTDAIGPEMMLVSTDGQLLSHDSLVAWIQHAYGSEPGFRLWVENIQVRKAIGGVAVVLYEEWQDRAAGRNVRQSTALFEVHKAAPNGVRWLHVHETRLDEGTVKRQQEKI